MKRFRKNRIVSDLIDSHGGRLDLNQIIVRLHEGLYTIHEYREVLALGGYSLCGFGELSRNQDVELLEINPDETKTALAARLSCSEGHVNLLRGAIEDAKDILEHAEDADE